jgi:hypothetical protein
MSVAHLRIGAEMKTPWALGIALTVVVSGGCGRGWLDRVDTGSVVEVVTYDGVTVTGRLVEIAPRVIRVVDGCDRPILIARTEVARVTPRTTPSDVSCTNAVSTRR